MRYVTYLINLSHTIELSFDNDKRRTGCAEDSPAGRYDFDRF